jgi:hypothetical protein
MASGIVAVMDTEANDLKVRENRLRRAADRQGLFLSRRRRRDPNARDFGRYALLRDGQPTHGVDMDGFYTLTLDMVEAILAAGAKDAEAEKQPEPEPAPVVQTQHPAPPLAPRRRSLGTRQSRR